MDTARPIDTAADDAAWEARGPIGYGWVLRHVGEVPLSPTIVNSGLVGLVALAAALAWYAVLHAPAVAGKLLPQ